MTNFTINKNKPALRFPEFEGEWDEKSLDDIAIISKGKGISKSDVSPDGELECILYGELYTHYSEIIDNIKSKTNLNPKNLILSRKNDVIIPASGETRIDIATASCVLKEGVALGGDLNIIRGSVNGIFLSYYLSNTRKKDIAQLAQGISVVHLYGSQLKSLTLKIPGAEEQKKIASFLASVDKRINLLTQKKEKLEQYKKGIMQQIFSQQLRFKAENGEEYPEWEEKRLGDIAQLFSGGTPKSSNKKFYAGKIPFIKSGEINSSQTEQYLSEEGIKSSSAKLVNKGDILLAIYGATSGEVAISKINGAINQAIICLRGNFNNTFLVNWLKFNKDSIVSTYLQGGQGNLSGEIVKSIAINLPSISEQQKIAAYLSSIDDKINYIKCQIELTRKWKQGLLQKMFV